MNEKELLQKLGINRFRANPHADIELIKQYRIEQWKKALFEVSVIMGEMALNSKGWLCDEYDSMQTYFVACMDDDKIEELINKSDMEEALEKAKKRGERLKEARQVPPEKMQKPFDI